MMMRHSVFVACVLSVLVASTYAATIVRSGLLSYNGMVLQSNGNGNQTSLAAINACDKSQEWVLDSDGFIYQKSNSSLVLDVQNSDPRNGQPVIMWNKKLPAHPNQLWETNSTGTFSKLNLFSLRKSSTSNNIVMSNNLPLQNFQFVTPPYTCPTTCTSHGDPHFTSWVGKKFDFQSANTVLFANFSGHRVYTVQFGCAPGVTCNEGFVVHPAGTTATFQLTNRDRAYFNSTAVTVPTGNSTYGIFSVNKAHSQLYTVSWPGATITYASYWWQYGWYQNIGITLSAFTVPGASLCAGPAAGQNPHTFGSQFIVSTQTTTAYQYVGIPFSYNPNYVPNYGPYTTNDTALIILVTTTCSVLLNVTGPYGQCFALVAPDFYYGTCWNDTIATGDISFAQASIDAYAFYCAEAARANGTTLTFPTSTTTTIVVGAATVIPAGSTTTFTIVAKDVNNVNRLVGGDIFTVTSTGTASLTFTIVDNNNGTYTVTYTATVEGSYTIWVRLNGVSNVAESPFNVTVVAVTSAITTSLVLGPVPTNTTSWFTIQARTSSNINRITGGDSFSVVFSGAGANFVLVGVVDNGDGTYTVKYIPYNVGYYTVDVQFFGTSILCSPYTIIVKN